ncbi:3-oxoadipate enol-lactonase [Pusillimonas caeni]|uniref:3-oxoadipate enol-lactonase n=1 Tax=Pusillimonas caeni TaxID=1348472 RepID=UPI000E59A8E5|nr:3-oxoadipate enol-lactonase [Pusillimonas caeni]TFL14792.1 3-oxoadipate enol-lactonase [Pusillimonas caeni]
MHYVQSNGIQIHYRIEGPRDAAALILANSIATELSVWDEVVEELAPHVRVIRYDARGQGGTDAPDEPYAIAQLARDVLGLMDHLELHKVNFCGLSLGGMVGMWLASHYPDRIERLALCNTAAAVPPPESWDQRAELARRQGMEAILPAVRSRWLSEGCLSEQPIKAGRLMDMVRASPVNGYIGGCAAIRDMDQSRSIAAILAPVLLVAGQYDQATPLDQLLFIRRQLTADAAYVELPCGHMSNVEKPRELARELLAFISNGDPPRSSCDATIPERDRASGAY